MHLLCECVMATDVVKTIANLHPPANATGVELQSSVAAVRYTMDDENNPSPTWGMIIKLTDMPKTFLIDDLLRIRFCRDGASNAYLNLHYFSGRDV